MEYIFLLEIILKECSIAMYKVDKLYNTLKHRLLKTCCLTDEF